MDNGSDILLALDPSSTAIGYAVLRSARNVIDAGVLLPRRAKDKPIRRIDSLLTELGKLVEEMQPTRCVIEMPGGKIHGRKKRSGGAGQSIYGWAAGEVRRSMIHLLGGDRVHCVDPNTWTNQTSKRSRQLVAASMVACYDPDRDRGMDCSDALALGNWWYGDVIRGNRVSDWME